MKVPKRTAKNLDAVVRVNIKCMQLTACQQERREAERLRLASHHKILDAEEEEKQLEIQEKTTDRSFLSTGKTV